MKQHRWKHFTCSLALIGSSLLLLTTIVQATHQAAPYVLTQSVNNIPVAQDTCISLIRQANQTEPTDSSTVAQLSDTIQTKLTTLAQLATQYETLNHTIAELETSLQTTQQQLEQAIDTAYQHLKGSQSDFDQMDSEAQLSLVQQDAEVTQQQQAVASITQQLNEQIATRDTVEAQHQALQYEIDTQQTELEQTKQAKSQLNQCQLYPYSTVYRDTQSNMINDNTQDLTTYLVQLDQLLQEIVPAAYRKVPYDTIYQAFQLSGKTKETVQAQLYGKQDIELSEEGEMYYSYARELNTFDIEILGNLAILYYFNTEDLAQLQQKYQQVLQIKQAQFRYFEQLNHEQFEQLKEKLADYLNTHSLTSEVDVQQIKRFHQRYQLKLVTLQQQDTKWVPTSAEDSGYTQTYATKSLQNQTQPIETPFSESSYHSSASTNLTKPTDETAEDSLSKIKKQLASPKHTPQANKSLEATPTPKNEETTKKGKQQPIKLPTTGEQQLSYTIALGLALIAAGLILIHLVLRRRQRQKLKKIKLD